MISRWFYLKDLAIELRQKGSSIKDIEKKLSIPRSTLSGWFRNVKLNQKQISKLENKKKQALVEARKKAVLWHNEQKQKRMAKAKKEALVVIDNIDLEDTSTLELVLAFLYLGEGYKTNTTGMRSSDPKILKFFIVSTEKLYGIKRNNIRCDLNLRSDQDPEKMKMYWSKELNLPISCFKGHSLDKRTAGRKTYSWYKGSVRFNWVM